jgi:dTDP-L-rhamnose 4-epimerase
LSIPHGHTYSAILKESEQSINYPNKGVFFMTVLITGGAGFIGSHVTDELIGRGYRVRILDNLCEQVHGPGAGVPDYLNPMAEFIEGDVRDRSIVESSLDGVDAVVHLAAAVGVGQSMYEMEHYISTNCVGTAVLLETLIKSPVKKLIVASSMSIYGEGLYRSSRNSWHNDVRRKTSDLAAAQWELLDAYGDDLLPVPTPESKLPQLSSIYALTKYDQERMCLIAGQAYNIPVVALRFFNVYGPRQSLSNPYTGVLAIFACRLMNDKPPLIFEDGKQLRDFVSVYDVARACRLAMQSDLSDAVLNIGSGRACTINAIAAQLSAVMQNKNVRPVITGKYRRGDIRHCYADIASARSFLGYAPAVNLEQGLGDLCQWLTNQYAEDHVDRAHAELSERGLAL